MRELTGLTVNQWGLVTAGQARTAGVTPQAMAAMARAGDLVRLTRGVYRLAGSPIDEHEDLRAAWLALDPARTAGERIAAPDVDVVSHRSAARVRGLGDLAADVMEFTVARRRRTDARLHHATVTARDWNLIDGLPVTVASRTVDDLAEERIDRGHLASVVRDSLSLNQATESDLTRVLTRHASGYGFAAGDGRGLLTAMLHEAGGLPEVIRVLIASLTDEARRALLDALRATGTPTVQITHIGDG